LRKEITIRKVGPEGAITQVAAAGQPDAKGAIRQRAAASVTLRRDCGHVPCDRDPRRHTPSVEKTAMKTPPNDRPRLVVFPPLILRAVPAPSIAAQWLVPLGVLTRFDQASRTVGGVALGWVGAATRRACRPMSACHGAGSTRESDAEASLSRFAVAPRRAHGDGGRLP
jgi:hypothetical protein